MADKPTPFRETQEQKIARLEREKAQLEVRVSGQNAELLIGLRRALEAAESGKFSHYVFIGLHADDPNSASLEFHNKPGSLALLGALYKTLRKLEEI